MNDTRETLLRKKEELVTRLASIRADLSRGLDVDSTEQAIQLENMDVLQELARISGEEIARIDERLKAHEDPN